MIFSSENSVDLSSCSHLFAICIGTADGRETQAASIDVSIVWWWVEETDPVWVMCIDLLQKMLLEKSDDTICVKISETMLWTMPFQIH